MRSSTILKKTNRRASSKTQKKKPANGFRAYMRLAAAAHKRAVETMFGSQGPASAVRKIDPKTGKVVAIIDAH